MLFLDVYSIFSVFASLQFEWSAYMACVCMIISRGFGSLWAPMMILLFPIPLFGTINGLMCMVGVLGIKFTKQIICPFGKI